MKTLTPVITVDRVEPQLGFWEELGFQRTMEVPEEDGLGFAAVASAGVEIMYQSKASVAADLPDIAAMELGPIMLFIRVESLDAIKPTLEAGDVVVPERKTFYGSREIAVRAPCGSIAIFAEFEE